jgi:exodeoxyribonuclease-1
LSFVVYDVETTGLTKGFDQILHFGAIKTDPELKEVERFEMRCRLLPHIVPAPRAFHITGASIADLLSAQRPSHYEMVCQTFQTLSGWGPAVFLGFNSIQFDEEFLRHAFYQCLHRPFLTNTNGNARADVLKLARAVAALHPEVLVAPAGQDGQPIFRLGELAQANGIHVGNQHSALADVEATLSLCRIVRDGAPDLWSRFVRFAQKAAVVDFMVQEPAFVLFEYFGARQEVHLLTDIGANVVLPNLHYCLDLAQDLDALRAFEGDELIARLKTDPRPIRKVRVNTAPLLCPLFEALPAHLGDFTEEEINQRALAVRADAEFVEKLVVAARASERVYEDSPHVELQLYNGFPHDPDMALMDSFHAAPWEDRVAIGAQFQDARLRRLSRRLIYFERPDLLTEEVRQAASGEIGRRLLGTAAIAGPWLTLPNAIAELDALLAETTPDSQLRLSDYRRHLVETQTSLAGH